MKLRRCLRLSVRALAAHRVRAGLSIASVAIGVAAVVLTSALGAGARADVMRRIEGMGGNVLVVRPARLPRLTARRAIGGAATTLRLEDHAAIAALPLVRHAAPGVESPRKVSAGSRAMIARVFGTTPELLPIRRFTLAEGRFLEDDDDRMARRVAVLGARVASTLFPEEDAVGRLVTVGGVPYDVIGVLSQRGVLADGSDDDNQVLIPVRTALRRTLNVSWLGTIFVSVEDEASLPRAQAAIAALLRERHGADDAGIQNTRQLLAMQQRVSDSLEWLAAGLAGGSLLIGGTGILALMLMSVKERTAEIGLRMAVGARPRDILAQFLIEASMLSLAGWLAGVVMGGALAAAAAMATAWRIGVPVEGLAACTAMALVIGLGFGSLPARKASRLPPIQALARP